MILKKTGLKSVIIALFLFNISFAEIIKTSDFEAKGENDTVSYLEFNIIVNILRNWFFDDVTGYMGLGTDTPDAKLDVAGQVKISGGAPGTGKVLTSDATGLATWETTTNGANAINDLIDGKTDITSVFLGSGAGTADDENNYNTAVGINALKKNTSGKYNVAIGNQALYNNTSGSYNMTIGRNALYNNTSGYSNVASGYEALYKNNTGYQNVATGRSTLYSNMTGYYNVANGHEALYKNISGHSNMAIGFQSLYKNTVGYSNTANGSYSLHSNTVGYSNAANGSSSLYSNTSGYSNAANGSYSLYFNTSGNRNIGIGYSTNYYNQAGSNNTIIGYEAGSGTVAHDKYGNIFLGYQAGYNEMGDNKLYIENSNSTTPLIGGDFSTDTVIINGGLTVTQPVDIGTPTLNTHATTKAYVDAIVEEGASPWNDISGGITYADGNVGIGTTTPSTNLKLDVEGKIGATEYCDQDGNNCVTAESLGEVGGGSCSWTSYTAYTPTDLQRVCNSGQYMAGIRELYSDYGAHISIYCCDF